jgi:hypothetical protein
VGIDRGQRHEEELAHLQYLTHSKLQEPPSGCSPPVGG